MNDKYLEARVARLEKLLSVKNEGKQVGTLYHVCTLKSLFKYILPKDELKSSGQHVNWLYGGNDVVSFTRDRFYIVSTDNTDDTVFIQLVIDGDKLSERYKIGPYNDSVFDKDYGWVGDEVGSRKLNKIRKDPRLSGAVYQKEPIEFGDIDPGQFEKEEAVRGPIKNISRYIKEIHIGFDYVDDYTISTIYKAAKKLKAVGCTFSDFMRTENTAPMYRKLRDLGLNNGDSVDKLLDVMSEFLDSDDLAQLFSGDPEQVRQAIKEGADLDAEYATGYLLEYYIQFSNSTNQDYFKCLELIVKSGANVNAYLSLGETPLTFAARNKCNIRVFKLLLDAGADVNKRDKYLGYTPLTAIINDKGASDIIRLLIKYGADVNLPDGEGRTPLQRTGYRDNVEILIDAGAKQ